jgi:nucleotide-binding universal stress UspA family protein
MGWTVLIPIDGSEQSWDALDFAIDHFEAAEITVINVVKLVQLGYMDSAGFYGPEAQQRAEENAEELLETARTRADNAGLDTDTRFNAVVERGDPVNTIIEHIEHHSIDHVVMGSRGRTGIKRILLGSVAEGVARRSPVPVTIVR